MSASHGEGRSRRYSVVVVTRAREHVAAGWSAYKTCRLLEQEFGVRPNLTTVRTWTDPEYAERFAEKNRRTARRSWTRTVGRKPHARTSAEWRLARMRELRDCGLSFHAIGQVAGVWWGEELSDDQVSKILGSLDARRAYRKVRVAA
jgi:hypothetical protein